MREASAHRGSLVGGGVPRYAEAKRLDAELVRPVRLITQHVLELPLRLLTGEEGANRAKLPVYDTRGQPFGRASP